MSGTTSHPVVWSAAANPERRKVEQGGGNFAWLPGPVHLWTSVWYELPIAFISEGDIAAWPFFCWSSAEVRSFFWEVCTWPCGAGDLGVGWGLLP